MFLYFNLTQQFLHYNFVHVYQEIGVSHWLESLDRCILCKGCTLDLDSERQ